MVTRGAILPFLDADAATAVKLPGESWKKRAHWYERMVYLIGHVNPADPEVDAFIQRCLNQYTGVWLKARTLRAIGNIADSRYKPLLEQLASNDFEAIAIGRLKRADRTYLRSAAIDALAGIGDQHSLSLLQRLEDWSDPELHAVYYRASEEIAWRIVARRQRRADLPEHE